jgi:hypothetical protein
VEKFTSYRIIPDLKVILCYFQGSIKMEDVVKLNLRFIKDEAYDLTFDVILDFKNSLALGYRIDILDYVEFLKKTIHLKERVKVAILTNSINQEFLISVYIPIAKLLKIDVAKFQQMDASLQWMGYSEGEKLRILESFKSIKGDALSMV